VQFEGPRLTPASDRGMLQRYGVDAPAGARLWRTITPAVLPEGAARRRIDPSRIRERAEQKGGMERAREEGKAATAVLQALRHAGVATRVETIRVQREPFQTRGAHAESFALETRFAKRRLWHVEIGFPTPVAGPLVVGDGRFLGLGVMAPVIDTSPAVHIFAIDPAEAPPIAAREALVHALRRAVMARVDEEFRRVRKRRHDPLPTFFTGHSADGAPARSGQHEHLFFLADDADGDGRIDLIAVISPRLADRTTSRHRERSRDIQGYLRVLDRALTGMSVLRAGPAGAPRLSLAPEPGDDDQIFGRAKRWLSRSLYRPTRHPRTGSVDAAVAADLLAECNRRGLPRPEVEVLELAIGPRGGLAARARLRFKVAVEGPLLLGRGSHFGGGLFGAEIDR
jgi:CRISPR-associated protein Csb2